MKRAWKLINHRHLCLCVTMCFVAATAFAARTDTDDRSNRSVKDERREQMRQEAGGYADQAAQMLKEVLEPTAKNQRPQPSQLEDAQAVLDQCKRYGTVFDEKQKGRFMLLQAWTSFYQGNLPQALSWSMRASKTNTTSQDAWNSQALFCMLAGKRPMIPRIEEPKKRSQRSQGARRSSSGRRRNKEPEIEPLKVQPYTEKGQLEFDLLGLRTEFLRGQFGRLEFVSAAGAEIEFVPGTNTLCILFQEVAVTPPDANDIAKQIGRNQDVVEAAMDMLDLEEVSHQPQNPLKDQQACVQLLMDACSEHPDIKFVQVNTNKAPEAKMIAQQSASDPQAEAAGPLVFAADPASKAQPFLGLQAQKPFLAIIDKEGKVKYAAPASGFMPAFILTELTGVEIDLESQPSQSQAESYDDMMFEDMMQFEPAPVQPRPQTDPNKPAADPNVPAPRSRTPKAPSEPRKKQADFPTQTLEDQVRAEKLLQSAQMHIEESRKLRMKNPRQGIEDARKVMEEYPNTEHAQKARELLRRVPERWKQRHNITDEELGY